MRAAWLQAQANTDGTGRGGAEFTAGELRAAKPDGVEIVMVEPDQLELIRDCDVALVHNCGRHPDETVEALEGKPVVRWWNDVAPHGSRRLTRWLAERAENVLLSPLHYEELRARHRLPEFEHRLIPPPVNLQPFRDAAARSNGRDGACSVAAWRGWGKSPARTEEWGRDHGGVDFYGGGHLAPPGSIPVPAESLPALYARYETFVYLPAEVEPFCRCAVEASAAGCKLVVNGLIGAMHWIPDRMDAIETAADDYWRLVEEVAG